MKILPIYSVNRADTTYIVYYAHGDDHDTSDYQPDWNSMIRSNFFHPTITTQQVKYCDATEDFINMKVSFFDAAKRYSTAGALVRNIRNLSDNGSAGPNEQYYRQSEDWSILQISGNSDGTDGYGVEVLPSDVTGDTYRFVVRTKTSFTSNYKDMELATNKLSDCNFVAICSSYAGKNTDGIAAELITTRYNDDPVPNTAHFGR